MHTDRNPWIEAAAAYLVFCGLGWLSRFVPWMFLVFVLFGILFPLAWAGIHHGWREIGFTRCNRGKAFLWGTATGAAWMAYTYIVFNKEAVASPLLGLQILIAFPVWLFIMSPFQEFFFRGWLQPRLQSVLGKGWGLLATSLAFAAWHFFPPLEGTVTSSLPLSSPVGVLSTTVFGLLMGYLYQRTGNMIAPWLAHALGGIGLVLIGRMVFIQMVP